LRNATLKENKINELEQ